MAISTKINGPIRNEIRDVGLGFLHSKATASLMGNWYSNTGTPTTPNFGSVRSVSFFAKANTVSDLTVIKLSATHTIQLSTTTLTTPNVNDTVYINGFERSNQNLIILNEILHFVIVFSSEITADAVLIGNDGTNSYDGLLSNICLFDKALTASEAERLYLSPNYAFDLDNNLLAYYIMSGRSTDDRILDYSQNANHLNLATDLIPSDAVRNTFKSLLRANNQGVYFSGFDYINLSSQTPSNSDYFSCSVWFVAEGNYDCALFRLGGLVFMLDNDREISLISDTQTKAFKIPIFEGKLVNIIFTNDNLIDVLKIYVNGQLVDQEASLGFLGSEIQSYIGYEGITYNRYKGFFYELSTWERILSEDEATIIYNQVHAFDLRESYNVYTPDSLKLYIKNTARYNEVHNLLDQDKYGYVGTVKRCVIYSRDEIFDYWGYPCQNNKMFSNIIDIADDNEVPYIEQENSSKVTPSPAWSFGVWAYVHRLQDTGSVGVLLDKRNSFYAEMTLASQITVGAFNGASYVTGTTSNINIVKYKWQYLTITFGGANINVYINGQLEDTVSISYTSPFPSSNPLTFFARITDVGGGVLKQADGLRGRFADMVFYEKQLTAAEVLQNYTATAGRYYH